MVNSHLNYAILSWGFACSRLKKMQKRIIRIITCSKYNAHTSPLFKSLRILTLDDMLRLNTLKFYYTILLQLQYKRARRPAYIWHQKLRTTPSWNDKNRIRWQTFTHISAHTRQRYPDQHIGDDHHPLSSGFHKKCKTLFNRTVRNCMLHPWLLYLSTHLKPILFSEVSIMSNEYTWIWICHSMCI